MRVSKTLSEVAASGWIPVNHKQHDFNVSLGGVVPVGTLTYEVQVTYGDLFNPVTTEKTESGSTVSYTSPDTITDTANGLGSFRPGDTIEITGSTGNDGTYEVDTVAVGSITTVEQTLGSEASSTASVIAATNKVVRVDPISHATFTSKTASFNDSQKSPVTGVRLNVTAYTSGSVTLTVIQGLL